MAKKTYYLVFFQTEEQHNKCKRLLLTLELMHSTLAKGVGGEAKTESIEQGMNHILFS